MALTPCYAIGWDEIGGVVDLYNEVKGRELKLPRGDDKKLVAAIRKKIYDDTADYDDENDMDRCWELVAVAHTPKTTHIEFKSDRGHLATTTIIWL